MSDTTILDDFFKNLARADEALLLLDYDGTIAPFREDRFEARPAPGLAPIIDTIAAAPNNRVVFVSGRPCDELLSLAGLSVPVEVWGAHGREYRGLDGITRIIGVSDEQQSLLREQHADLAPRIPDNKLEVKTGCLAFHWRGVDPKLRDELVAAIEPCWHALAREHQLEIKHFDGGIELCVPGRTKGDAVEAILAGVETSQTAVAFLGDDLTDEDGFRALGDRGLSVLVRNVPRETLAPVRLSLPDGVRDFLARWSTVRTQGAPA